MNLLISSRNKHKLAEINSILDVSGLTLVSLDEFKNIPDVVEDGDTFVKNAIKKAMTIALITKKWTMADDSGLEVKALNGEPGVISARYAGEPVSYEANNRKLLGKLKGIGNREARFVCVIALSSPHGKCQIVEGACSGVITEDERGRSGFGYDPLFIPDGHTVTFAEMDAAQKNVLSHRYKALMKARQQWVTLFSAPDPDDFVKM
jgi:XTP/dITP diphosphohydrolase